MVEYLFHCATQYFFPSMQSQILTVMDDMHKEQQPPYSKGIIFVTLRERWKSIKWSNRLIFSNLSEPIFALMVK